jgi:hypothetical protein
MMHILLKPFDHPTIKLLLRQLPVKVLPVAYTLLLLEPWGQTQQAVP